jgi:trehalose 6-phosphate synthase/phosphatase
MTATIAPGYHRRKDARRATRPRRLVIVSNRLPTTARFDGEALSVAPSNGGLASGLGSVHRDLGRLWIGWPGLAGEVPGKIQADLDRHLQATGARAVSLGVEEIAGYYDGFANGALWPALHGRMPDQPVDPIGWALYRAVNARFADVVLRELQPGDVVWIHDYQLMLVPRMLRRARPDLRIAFFLHTPFPQPVPFESLPGVALLDGLLGSDVIGFQTASYVQNFAAAVRQLLGRQVELVSGSGLVDDRRRRVAIHPSPIGVEVETFTRLGRDPALETRVARLRGRDGPLLVGVDRLDPTKGIPNRLEAFTRLLELRPELRGKARLLQLAVPSRERVPAYRELRARVERMVSDLNQRFGTDDWMPVEFQYGTVDRAELVARYRAADLMLVTPIRDGMNLVAKEFVASRTDQDGVLVLSRHAGAAVELSEALLVDPNDIDGMARAYAAGVDMSRAERRVRMRRLQATVRGHDVRRWADSCLGQLDAAVRNMRGKSM